MRIFYSSLISWRLLTFLTLILIAGFSCRAWSLEKDEVHQLRLLAGESPTQALAELNSRLNEDLIEKRPVVAVELMNIKLGLLAQAGNMQEMVAVAVSGQKLARKLNDHKQNALFGVGMAEAYSQMNRWPEAKVLYDQAIDYFANNQHIPELIFTRNKLGLSHYYNLEYDEALNILLKAYEQASLNIPQMGSMILPNIALIFEATNNLDKAIEYHRKTLEIVSESGDPAGLSIIYYNLGYTYLRNKQPQEAEKYLKKSEQIARDLQIVQGIAFASSQLGQLYLSKENFELAEKYFKESYRLGMQLKNQRLQTLAGMGLTKAYLQFDRIAEAELIIRQIEPLLLDNESQLKLGFDNALAELSLKKKAFRESAIQYRTLVKKLNEFYKEKNDSKIQEMQAKFGSRLQEKENKLLKQKNELQKLKLSSQEKQNMIYFLSFLVLIFLLLFITFVLRKEKERRRKFATLAMTDELTGVDNRRQIFSLAKIEFDNYKKLKQDTTIAIVDLDYFKQINDTYGHDMGDQVLRAFADAVKKVIRDKDCFGRIGGEEWMLILPNSTPQIISTIFNRIKQEISKIKIDGLEQEITFSMGATQFVEDDDEFECCAKRADEGLYTAKENGRDQFVVA
ncbi:GGDEF domain-containing protein [Aliikangiella sp. G2MR2-5]|uniref:GGDEF domain-containing protein n=1 Tax=Aliikangiella sp. G2MR2-5 TaxID=2788943 RepID=UPI0018AB3798|nr:diguanylate cyclase [Aliikangiella sp. G2MR2-5]